ncbi:MAG: CapA family protein [Paracoccaceae bacterium]
MPLVPNTPYETLAIPNPVAKGLVSVVTAAAERFGFWKHPRKGAASDMPEMNVLDSLYWAYKCKNPIELPEADLDQSEFMTAREVRLAAQDGAEASDGVTLSFVGDILRTHRAGVTKDQLYTQVQDLLFKADIAVANYESPVTTQPLVDEVIGGADPAKECASEDQFEALTSHQGRFFDVLNLANNHIYDMGVEGIECTLKALNVRDILQVGVNEQPEEANMARTLERNGIRFGFASCTLGTNGRALPEGQAHSVNIAKLTSKHAAPDISLLKAQISNAKAGGSDFVIAMLHWGHEFELFPRRAQQIAAQELADFGADLIVCHHPHVVQPIQLYRTRAGDRTVPIAYSLGSLLWGFAHEHISRSTIMQITVQKVEDRAEITTLRATPVRWRAYEADGGVFQKIERLDL